MNDIAIRAERVGYRAGRSFAIRELELTVPRGSVYGFLGPNGAGKTTLIRMVLGMIPLESGRIHILGEPNDGRHLPGLLARIGYVPERPHLWERLTLEEALDFHGAFYRRWDQDEAVRLLSDFGVPSDRPFGKLSKGESGKGMVALALAQRPDLLILDEPTDGLDPVVRRDVLSAVMDYVSETGATVFVSSHLVHELERICDWVGVIDDGKMVAEMPMEEFRGGIRRLRVARPPAVMKAQPFTLLSRQQGLGSDEQWVVRGWEASMAAWFESHGAEVREEVGLDLEEGFVELLRSARPGGLRAGEHPGETDETHAAEVA